MDASIARSRLASVIKPDTMTVSQADFLVTHVPMQKLLLLNRFEVTPNNGTPLSEEDVYYRLVLNPEGQHQFVAVYGQSGTGKSHLIRWLEAKYRNDRPDSDVVLFIRRSDNTLKGTIRQLLETPEVRNIANRDVIERLVKATVVVDEEKLKGSIYYDFINEIQYDQDVHDIALKTFEKKRLVAFLSNDTIRDLMMSPEGPVERIFSRIAENTNVDRDTIARFIASDFIITPDLHEQLSASSDPKAEKLARKLIDNEELSARYADYMNQFVNEVIQHCAGIQPGDFGDIFKAIRRELMKTGKTLTLFIEDVTSFTGVDEPLLDALLVEHTGDNDLCRISSFVGTTSGYLEKNFRDNHKDRITDYLYVPDNAFNEKQLIEFFARYLNAMSLSEDIVNKWAINEHASSDTLPIHTATDGLYWDTVVLNMDKEINLYPFTIHSIKFFYENALIKGKQTPRYILRDIIEPVVKDILYNKAQFPSTINFSVIYDDKLRTIISNQVSDRVMQNRLLNFLTIWGDGTPYIRYSADGTETYASLRKEILHEFGLPTIALLKSDQVIDLPKKPDDDPGDKDPTSSHPSIDVEIRLRVQDALRRLDEWTNGESIDYSATSGIAGVLRNAVTDLNGFVESSINWQAEGISLDNLQKVKRSSRPLVALERATRSVNGFYMMPAEGSSTGVIAAIIRWKLYGKSSWNYEDSYYDTYTVTKWISSVKNQVVGAINDKNDTGVSYIIAALASEIYRLILCGSYRGESLKSFNIENLFKITRNNTDNSHHHSDWNQLVRWMQNKDNAKNNTATVQKYFDIRQGTSGGSIIVLDSITFKEALDTVKRFNLVIPNLDDNTKDSVKQRNDVFNYYFELSKRIIRVAESEKSKARPMLEVIDSCLIDENDDEDEVIDKEVIEDIINVSREFYDEANKAKLSLKYPDFTTLKKSVPSIAAAISRIRKGLAAKTPLETIMEFSTDPIAAIEPFVGFLSRLNTDMDKAEQGLQKREERLGIIVGSAASDERFRTELEEIHASMQLLAGEVGL